MDLVWISAGKGRGETPFTTGVFPTAHLSGQSYQRIRFLCKENGLPSKGKKDTLIQRLLHNENNADVPKIAAKTEQELVDLCRFYGIDVGNILRNELLNRLISEGIHLPPGEAKYFVVATPKGNKGTSDCSLAYGLAVRNKSNLSCFEDLASAVVHYGTALHDVSRGQFEDLDNGDVYLKSASLAAPAAASGGPTQTYVDY